MIKNVVVSCIRAHQQTKQKQKINAMLISNLICNDLNISTSHEQLTLEVRTIRDYDCQIYSSFLAGNSRPLTAQRHVKVLAATTCAWCSKCWNFSRVLWKEGQCCEYRMTINYEYSLNWFCCKIAHNFHELNLWNMYLSLQVFLHLLCFDKGSRIFSSFVETKVCIFLLLTVNKMFNE